MTKPTNRPLISCSYPRIALPNISTIAQPNKLKAGIYLRQQKVIHSGKFYVNEQTHLSDRKI